MKNVFLLLMFDINVQPFLPSHYIQRYNGDKKRIITNSYMNTQAPQSGQKLPVV